MTRISKKQNVILTDTAGVLMIIGAALFGWLPGPGGIPLLLGGLALLARNHTWARRLQDYLLKHAKGLIDIIFPNHIIIKALYDVMSVLALVLVFLYIDEVNQFIARGFMFGVAILSVTVFVINRRRHLAIARVWRTALRKH